MLDIIRQMFSLGWEFAGHHLATVFWVLSLLLATVVLGPEFAGHHPANAFLGSRVCWTSYGKCVLGSTVCWTSSGKCIPWVGSLLDIIRQMYS